MNTTEKYVEIGQLCLHYEIETSFIEDLSEYGLMEISNIEQVHYIHHDRVGELEKILRLHRDLELNIGGIASVMHLLQRVESLQGELIAVRSRLQLYEEQED